MPKINSLEVVHQDTNKDSYENLHDIIVALKGSMNQEMIDSEARAAYEVLLEMYVNDKEAFARRVETLSAEFGNSVARVVEEMLVYASKSEAYAKKISTVEAELGNAKASIEQEAYVRVTEDEALASLITTVEASVASNTAAITTETTARVTADSALASQITTLNATVASNTAAITSEATARATADSANASAINTVTARLDTGDFAAVKTESSATATKVGNIEAKWGVTTNVNGYVAGIQLLNGGSTSSSFTVDATKFIVKKPDGTNGIVWNGSTSRLDISGDVYANNFYGNVVNTGNIVTGAVTTNTIASNAVSNGASSFSGSSPASVGITTSGGAVFVWASYLVPNANVFGYSVYLTRDGSIIGSRGYNDPGAGSDGVLIKIDYPSAGYHTYGISVTGDGPIYNIDLMVLETKR